MKVILSRKGFDSSFGGTASVILPNGKDMISFPITSKPCELSDTDDINKLVNSNDFQNNNSNDLMLSDLNYAGYNYLDLLRQLCKDSKGDWDRFILDRACHLDPDIREFVTDKRLLKGKKWISAFGQCNGSLTHLINNNVNVGDLFIFFGWFRHTKLNFDGTISYDTKYQEKQVMFGYLQIGEIIDNIDISIRCPWHPHAKKENYNENNKLFLASDNLCIDGSIVLDSKGEKIPGFGMFNYCDELSLTKNGMSRTRWDKNKLFSGLEKTKITHHSKRSIKEDYFQSARIGQEFIIDGTKEVKEWAVNIIKKGKC